MVAQAASGTVRADDDYPGIAQQLKHVAEQTKQNETLQTTLDRTKRLSDKRQHLEEQAQEDVATIDVFEDKLKKQLEELEEKRERLTTLKKEYAEALTDLHATGMHEPEDNDESGRQAGCKCSHAESGRTAESDRRPHANGGTSRGSERQQWRGDNARTNVYNDESQGKQATTTILQTAECRGRRLLGNANGRRQGLKGFALIIIAVSLINFAMKLIPSAVCKQRIGKEQGRAEGNVAISTGNGHNNTQTQAKATRLGTDRRHGPAMGEGVRGDTK